MADINHIITHGIGTPADIPHFVLVGLSANPGAPGENQGSASITLGAVTTTAAGTVLVQGAADVTLGGLTLSAEGTVGSTTITGAFAQTLGAVTTTAAGTVLVQGSASIMLGALTVSTVQPEPQEYFVVPVQDRWFVVEG